MRSWTRSSERQLCEWKNLRRVPQWACGNSSRVGQALEQIGDQGAVQVVEPVQNLREVQLQGSGETIAVAGFLVYQLATFFYQEMQQASLLGIGLQGAQRLTMAHQQIQQRSRVMGIALGTRRGECLAVVRCGSGVYREQHQVRVFGQSIDERSARLLQTDGNGAAAEAPLQIRRPDFKGFGSVVQLALCIPLGAGRQEPPEMLPVGPINGCKRDPFWFCRCGFR